MEGGKSMAGENAEYELEQKPNPETPQDRKQE